MVLKKPAEAYRRRILLQRIRGWGERMTYGDAYEKQRANTFVNFSELLLKDMKIGRFKGKVIFIGQGMRPLFEAASTLNKHLKLVNRRRIRYFIFPIRASKPHYRKGEAGMNLRRLRIVDDKTKNFVLIDFASGQGHRISNARERLKNEIKKAQPDARVRVINQYHKPLNFKPVADAIHKSEDVARPTLLRKRRVLNMVMIEPEQKAGIGGGFLMIQQAIKEEMTIGASPL